MAARPTEQIKAQWDVLTDWYSNTVEAQATCMYEAFLPWLQLATATNIVEIGCGSGNGVQLLMKSVSEECKITASDLNDEMIELFKKRGFPERVTVESADSEQLPYADGTFDRYISNLVLQIVETPEKMLSEAFRTLSPGGIAMFTVWGKKEQDNFWELPSCFSAGAPPSDAPAARTNYHLNDPEKLKSMVKAAGFSRGLWYFSSIPMTFTTVDEVIEGVKMMPMYPKNSEREEAIDQALRAMITERLEVRGQCFTFEALNIVAYK